MLRRNHVFMDLQYQDTTVHVNMLRRAETITNIVVTFTDESMFRSEPTAFSNKMMKKICCQCLQSVTLH